MSETAITSQEQQQVSVPTNWQEVFSMADEFNLSNDPAQRAVDVAQMKTEDWIAMTTLLHSKLAPETDASPTTSTMKVKSPDGTNMHEMMVPEGRYRYFEHAAQLINKLGQELQPGLEEDFLSRAGNIVALSTLIAHPFEDGNGRTAFYRSFNS